MKTWKGMTLTAAALALGVGVAALPALAGPGTRGPRGGERMARHLDLTEEQRATWKKMHEEFAEASKPAREQLRAAHEQVREALESGQADATAIGQLVLSVHEQRAQLAAQHEAQQARLRSTLTPEQQAKFDAFKSRHARREKRGRHGRRGFGPKGPAPEGGGEDDPR